MNSPYEYLREVRPDLTSMQCGGWLATSPRGVAIRIGIVGVSETDAREKFRESLARWITILSDSDEDVPDGSALQVPVIVHS
jgi:hypothetical protein